MVEKCGAEMFSGERRRPDSFINHYMGKIYDHPATEIMSMGMEAVFTRTQGGLPGVGNSVSDPEMRNFVLGILAGVPGTPKVASRDGGS